MAKYRKRINKYPNGGKINPNKPLYESDIVELPAITITNKLPEWLQYRREFEENNPRGLYLYDNRSRWANKQDLIDKYEKETNQYIYDQLIKNNPRRSGESRGEYIQRITGDNITVQDIIEQNKNRHSSTSENVYTNYARGLLGMFNNPFAKVAKTALETNTYAPHEREQITNSLVENIGNMADILSVPYNATVGTMYTRGQGQDDYNMASGLSGRVPENRNTMLEIFADPLNIVGVGTVSKANVSKKAIQQLGKYATENTPLKNAYKLNPWAFKPNPDAYYRVLGKEGVNDALESGIIRANPKNIDSFSGTPIYDRPFFSKGVPFDRDWKSPFKNKKGKQVVGSIYPDETMVEVFGHDKFHKTRDLVTSPIDVLNSSDEGINFYKRDWLKGYKEVPKPKPNFKSEIDWAKWNKEIPENKALMKEYNAIEQQSKANGTWMKNPDGSDFVGSKPTQKDIIDNPMMSNDMTPEEAIKAQFIQQQSQNLKNAMKNRVDSYHGSPNSLEEFNPDIRLTGRTRGEGIYTSPFREFAEGYAREGDKRIYHLYQNASNPQLKLEEFNKAADIRFKKFLRENPKGSKDFDKKFDEFMKNEDNLFDKLTDEEYFKLQPGYDFYKASPEEYVVPFTNYPKSALGNNGMFDMSNPNIYKSLVPAVGGAVLLNSQHQKQDTDTYQQGGIINSNNMKKQYRIPKYLGGGAIGALATMGIQTIGGIARRQKEKKIQAQLREQMNREYMNNALAEDNAILDDYPTNGLNNYGHYMANGGNIGDPPVKRDNIGDPPVKRDNIAVNVFSYRQKKNVGLPRKKTIYQSSLDEYNKLLSSKKELEKKIQNKESKWYQTNRDVQQELNVINSYLNSSNFDDVKDYYKSPISYNVMANGGNLSLSPNHDTIGGNLVPLADGVDKAIGNTHDESTIDNTSGIKLLANGEPQVEIEDDEIVKDGQMVFSDRLKFDKKNTYAKKAETFARKRNKLEEKLNNVTDRRSKNSIERNILKIDNKEKALFEHQEIKKLEKGIDQPIDKFNMGGNPVIAGFSEAFKQGNQIRAINKGTVLAKMRQNAPLSSAFGEAVETGMRHLYDGTFNFGKRKEGEAIKEEDMLSETMKPQGVQTNTNIGLDPNTTININEMKAELAKLGTTGTQTGMRYGGKVKLRKGGIIPKAKDGMYRDFTKFLPKDNPDYPADNYYYNPETGEMELDYAYITGNTNRKLSKSRYFQKPSSLDEGENADVSNNKKFDYTKLVPYADNLVNAFLTSKTPNVRKPNLQRSGRLNTAYNVNPQLGAVRDAVTSTTNDIINNTSSSNVARSELANIRLAGMRKTNALLANKENIENQLKNQQVLNNQTIDASNLAKMDKYNEAQTMRELGIQSAVSRNITNAVGDYRSQEKEENMRKYQAQQLLIEAKKYNSGIGIETILENPYVVEELRNNPQDLQYYKDMALAKDTDGNYINQYAANLFLQQFPEFK